MLTVDGRLPTVVPLFRHWPQATGHRPVHYNALLSLCEPQLPHQGRTSERAVAASLCPLRRHNARGGVLSFTGALALAHTDGRIGNHNRGLCSLLLGPRDHIQVHTTGGVGSCSAFHIHLRNGDEEGLAKFLQHC